ncbi:hypothetical protein L6164_032449 [Bauhinia variegata]|uniref:Uncharacterized protein n=1 Tax=Bauhinia variegata TaxID=167791 RepID=A0ACB9KNP2_BAUVA|nr:hypothetical protein L6164_032449 [Bauhinia variegata]
MDSNCLSEPNHSASSLDDIKQGRLGLTKPLKADTWHGATQIELMYSNLSELPVSPNCPLLRVLLLQGNADLMEIPPLFFNHMPLLHTLDLSHTSITDLPYSFFGLVELRVLYLRGCELFMELPPEIGQLKNLEELDLNETQIAHVPTEIRELINLQKLTLSFYEYDQNISQVIPKGLISELTRLSFLSIDVNPDHSNWDETAEVILQEISRLRYLKTLILYVPRVELLKHIPENKDLDFRLVAGRHKQRIISRVPPMVEEKFKQSNRSLRFVYGKGKHGTDVPQEINMVLGRTNTFFLDRHMTIKHLSEFGLMNLDQLQMCILAECNEMQTIVENRYSYGNAFSCLQALSVFYMKNLRSIWKEGTPPSLFLGKLKSLTFHTCPNLTTVFTLEFIDNLVNLEELVVHDCPKVTTLITLNSSAFSEKSFLPKLRKVSLLYLPELVSISSGLQIGQMLEKIGFYHCPKLQTLSTRELSSKRLKAIKGETKWWEALRWKEAMGEQNMNDVFCPIDEEVDIMTQLVADVDESSSSKNQEIHMPSSFESVTQMQLDPLLTQQANGDWRLKNLVNEIVQGKELAEQLKICLRESSTSRGTIEVLAPKILATFEKALAMATGKVESMAEASQATAVAPSQMAESIPWSGVFLNEDSARYSKEQGGKATTKWYVSKLYR